MGNKLAKKTSPNSSKGSSKVQLISVKQKKSSRSSQKQSEDKSQQKKTESTVGKQNKNDLAIQEENTQVVDDGNKEENGTEAIISLEEQNNSTEMGEVKGSKTDVIYEEIATKNYLNNNNSSEDSNAQRVPLEKQESEADVINALNASEDYVLKFYDSILAEAFKEIVEINRKDSLIATTGDDNKATVEEGVNEEKTPTTPNIPTTYVSTRPNIQELNPFFKNTKFKGEKDRKEIVTLHKEGDIKHVRTEGEREHKYIMKYGEKLSLDILTHVKLHLS